MHCVSTESVMADNSLDCKFCFFFLDHAKGLRVFVLLRQKQFDYKAGHYMICIRPSARLGHRLTNALLWLICNLVRQRLLGPKYPLHAELQQAAEALANSVGYDEWLIAQVYQFALCDLKFLHTTDPAGLFKGVPYLKTTLAQQPQFPVFIATVEYDRLVIQYRKPLLH